MRQICFALWYRNRLCLKGIKQPTIMGIGHRKQYGCMIKINKKDGGFLLWQKLYRQQEEML